MSTIHDTNKLTPYKTRNVPQMDASLLPYLSQEHQSISNSISQLITALKSIEARIVAGGL